MLASGCTTTGSLPISITDVQNDAVLACSFLPTAATVANILAAGNPILVTAEAVAQAICAAITPTKTTAKLRGNMVLPEVNGVVIQGSWVK